jgi:DNA repair protein RadC
MLETTQVAEIMVSYRPAISDKPVIKTPLDAYTILKDQFFPDETISLQERFVVMYLNNANRVLGIYPVSLGGINKTIVDIRLIFSVALRIAATSIMLAHNHPSGSLNPSSNDITLTAMIKEASRFLDIKLYDHLILSSEPGKYLSFAEEALLH